jgi:hypothetical protein
LAVNEIVFSFRNLFPLVALKRVKVLPAVIKSDHALNALVSIHHAIGLASGHAFRSGIHESL